MRRTFTFSEAGGHIENQDAVDLRAHSADDNCCIAALADGQGGRAGAARAAQVACRTTLELATTLSARKLLVAGTWPTLLRSADQGVAADDEAGLTTLVGFCVAGDVCCGASSGDSALLAIQGDGRVEELTGHQHKNPPVGSRAA